MKQGQASRVKLQGRGLRTEAAGLILLLLLLALLPSISSAAEPLENILREHVREHYPWSEVEVSDISAAADLPHGRPSRIVVEKGLPGRTVFGLTYPGGRHVSVSVVVRAFDTVVMSRRAMKKGSQVRNEDLYTTLMEVSRLPRNAVSSPELITGRVLTRSVIANMPVSADMLSDTTAMKKGQRVSLVYQANGLSISAMGELRENARVGSYVKVVNLSSKKIVSGMLAEDNTVRVEF